MSNALSRILIGIGMLVSLTACDGARPRTVIGQFDVRVPFLIHSEPKSLYVSGTFPANVKMEGGITGASLDVIFDGKSHKFSVPRSAFKNPSSIELPAKEIGQDFSISSRLESRILSKRTAPTKVGCTYCDICLTTQNGMDLDGNATVTTGMAYNCGCDGTRIANREFTLVEERFVAKFTSTDGTALGRFVGRPDSHENTKDLSFETECR